MLSKPASASALDSDCATPPRPIERTGLTTGTPSLIAEGKTRTSWCKGTTTGAAEVTVVPTLAACFWAGVAGASKLK